jgi:hypothetical protein
MNSNKEIDTIANELNNSVKHQESESVFYQKKKDIIEPKIVAQAAVTLPVTAELDIFGTSTRKFTARIIGWRYG